jgi:fatty acid desaturase
MQPKIASVISKEEFSILKSVNNKVALMDLCKRLILNIFLVYLIFVTIRFSYVLTLIIWYIYSVQFQFWGYAGLGHEALHGRVFTSNVANQTLYAVCSALTWSNGAMFKDTHFRHHRAPFSPEDIEAKSEQKWGFWDLIGYAFIDFKSLFRRTRFTLVNSLGFYPDFTRLNLLYMRSAQLNLVFNVTVYSFVYIMSENIMITLLLIISPFSGTLLNKILAKSQHHNLEKLSDEGALKFSRTLKVPKFLRFLYANMNYHAEHHFSPAIPYYNLPEFHNLLSAQGLVESQSLSGFLYRELRSVRLKND